IPEIPIGQSIHQAIANGVQGVRPGAVQLRHAGPSEGANLRKASGRRSRERGEGRVCPKGNAHAKVIDGVGTAGTRESHVRVRCVLRWLFLTVKVRGQEGIDVAAQRWEANEGGYLAGQHLCTVESEWLRTEECRTG